MRRYLFIGGLILLAGVAAVAWPAPKGPKYNGRTYAEWLVEYSKLQQKAPKDVVQKSQAAEALRQFGTNGTPVLLGFLFADDSLFKTKCIHAINRLPLINAHLLADHEKVHIAFQYLVDHGHEFSNAVPEIVSVATNSNSSIRHRAATALVLVGADKQTVLAVVQPQVDDPDEDVRVNARQIIKGLGITNQFDGLK